MATVGEVTAKLRQMQAKAPAAATIAAVDMGLDFTAEVKVNELSRRSHSKGTPTNSPPGQPPSLISGDLRGSVRPEPPVVTGPRASVTVGGTVVYARIQELGGEAGRDHASKLPPRPYLKPAAERAIATGQARRAAIRGWRTVMGR